MSAEYFKSRKRNKLTCHRSRLRKSLGWEVLESRLPLNGDFVFAKSFGGTGADGAVSMAHGPDGSMYVTGQFSGLVDFDPGIGTTELSSQNFSDVFVLKLDLRGDFEWVISLGGSYGADVAAIEVDSLSNVYLTGEFGGTMDLDPGNGVTNLSTDVGDTDVYIAKFNGQGDLLWAKSIGGDNLDSSNELTVDVGGNVFTVGSFNGTADFDPSPTATFELTSENARSSQFISKLNSDGNFEWASALRLNGGLVDGIAIDNDGTAFVGGSFVGTIQLGGSSVSSLGSFDAFVTRVDSDGNFVWVRSFGGVDWDSVFAITTDNSGALYVAGGFFGTIDADPDTGAFTLTSLGHDDAFVSKFDKNGNFDWSKSIGGAQREIANALAVDDSQNVYFIKDDFVEFSVYALDRIGTLEWSKTFGPSIRGAAIAVNPHGNVDIAGYFHQTVDFDPAFESYPLTSRGSRDAFILELTGSAIDLGDAPDPYFTTISRDGARHAAFGPMLGTGRDSEEDGQPNVNASGDGNDEDGVTFGKIQVGQQNATVTVTVSNVGVNEIPKLDAWIDFNGDGSWSEVGEQIFDSKVLTTSSNGVNVLTFDVPSGAKAGTTYARFRLSTSGDHGQGGLSFDGEVEDYAVSIDSPTTSAGHFAGPTALPVFNRPGVKFVYEADLNLDGYHDIVFFDGDPQITWMQNSPSGYGFETRNDLANTGSLLFPIVPVDFDSDGDIDFVAGTSINVVLIRNDSSLSGVSFSSIELISNRHLGSGIAVADIDADGDQDIISSYGAGIFQLINNGSTFSDSVILGGDYNVLAVADFDRNGLIDILYSGAHQSRHFTELRWLAQNAPGSYQVQSMIYDRLDCSPDRVRTSVADFDNDGRIDVVFGSDVDRLRFSRSQANGGFANPVDIGSSLYVHSAFTAADFDGDGTQDVLTYTRLPAATNGEIKLFLNDGNAGFSVSRTVLSPSATVSNFSVFDLENDGDLDFITGERLPNQFHNVAFDFGDAPYPYGTNLATDGARHVSEGPRIGSNRDSETDGPLNGTSLEDDNTPVGGSDDEDGVTFGVIQVGAQNATVTVTVSNVGVNEIPKLDAWIDFNGDGSWDGVGEQIFDSRELSTSNNGVNVLTFDVPSGAKSGATYARFRLSTAGNLSPKGFAGNGEVEDCLVTIIAPSPSLVIDNLSQVLGNSFNGGYGVSLGDLDSDGDLDAFVANSQTYHQIWMNEYGVFSSISQIFINVSQSRGVVLGDLDSDGDLDAFVVNSQADHQVLMNESGTFSSGNQSLVNVSQSRGVKLGDLDSDGDLDAFVINSLTNHQIWINQNGAFNRSPLSLLNSSDSTAIDLADLDGDGDLDALITNFGSDHQVWINENGDFSLAHTLPNSAVSRSVSLGDIDGDGDVDAFVANSTTNHQIWVNALNSNGVFFLSSQTLSNSASSRSISLGDLDGDGDLDAFITVFGDSHQIWTCENGVFSLSNRTLLNTSISRSIGLGDLDGDGDIDAFVANDGSTHQVWTNYNPDLGDAPFETTLATNGARHDAKGPQLGATRDAESDGPLNGTGLEDDNSTVNGIDDEDGVTFGTMAAGHTVSVTVDASNAPIAGAKLYGWIDFNVNGNWNDAGEHIFAGLAVFNGVQELHFTVPAGASIGATYARFRISTQVGLFSYGFASDGEVEDYAVTIYDPNVFVTIPSGTDGNDIVLRRSSDGRNVELVDRGVIPNATLFSRSLDSVDKFTIIGQNTEAETLTVDYSFGGFFSIPQGIHFDAGSGPGDGLDVKGTGGTEFNFVSSGSTIGNASITASDGTDGDTIFFTGVEPLSILNALDINVVGPLNVGSQTLTLDSVGFTTLGQTTTLTGGTISAPSGLVLATGQTILGRGTISAPVYSEAGSTITLNGNMTLGDSTAFDAVELLGRVNVGANTLTLLDAHQAVLGSQTTLGTSTANGTLVSAGGVRLAAGKTVSGRGVISTLGSYFENQGFVFGSAPGLTFQHLVTGAGSFGGTVTFDGGTSFGNSPTKTTVTGNATFTSNNVATVELGGLTAGSGYDQVQASGTIALAGGLNVQLINGFTPSIGNSFVLYTAASITGTFASVSYPTLPAGLGWKLQYTTTNVTLTVVSTVPPTVISAELNGNALARQRSMIQYIKLTFSSVVNIGSGAIEVRAIEGVSVNGAAPPSLNFAVPLRPLEISVANSRTVVIVRFADATGNLLTSLDDGKYRLTINGSLVTDNLTGIALDGDANGSPGGIYTYHELDNTSQPVDTFFRLYGDQDGDRDVDAIDFLAFTRSNNKTSTQTGYLWFFDFNGDQVVNGTDLTQFNLRRNRLTIRL